MESLGLAGRHEGPHHQILLGLEVKKLGEAGSSPTGLPNQLSNNLKLCVRHQSDAIKTRLSSEDRMYLGRYCWPKAGP